MWSIGWQAAVGRGFFVSPSLFGRIKRRLIAAHSRPGRILLDYLLLPAEIHVLSQLPSGDTPRGVSRDVASMITRWVREFEPIRSPVMAGPYKAFEIVDVDELRREMRMLAWRPVVLGLCATPTHYAHGTLRVALGLSSAQGFNIGPLLGVFGHPPAKARQTLRSWIADRPSKRELLVWELSRGLLPVPIGAIALASGTSGVLRADTASLLASSGTGDVKGALQVLGEWVAAKRRSNRSQWSDRASANEDARQRALVGCLAVRHHLCSCAEVARHYGKAKSTMSEQMTACRARRADASMLATPLDRILSEAAQLRVAQ